MNGIQGKVAIITGASSGIGAATARELARHGATVVLAARRAATLEGLAAEIRQMGGTALVVPTDVTKLDDLQRLVDTAIGQFGQIDILFNNAGVVSEPPLAKLSDDELTTVLDINVLAPIRLAQLVIPHMKRRRSGHIIITGSVGGYAVPLGIYGISKFALRGFADALRREVRRSGVKVSLLAPGFVRTEMTSIFRFPMPGPEIIAQAVVGLVQRPRRTLIVPGWYRPLIWLHAAVPWLGDQLFSRLDVERLKRP